VKLKATVEKGVTVIAPAGELNLDSVSKFNDAVDGNAVAAAFEPDRRDFLIDCRQLTGIDSAGLEALTALQRQCDEQLGMLRFAGADKTLLKILEMTRLDQRFSLHKDADEALASFGTA